MAVVGKRNRFIEDLKISGQLSRKRRLLQTAAVKGLEWVLIAKTRLTGQGNLNLVTKKIGQERVTVAANHTSDTDHPSLERVFIKNGYGAIADRLVFPAGLKMWDRPQTEWAMWGMNTVPIAAPAYFEEATRIAKWSLSEEELALVVRYQANMRWLTRASLKVLLPEWKRGEVVPVVYPETTRSRSGLIERGREETDGYFRHGWILPLMIQGPGEVFPPEHHPRWDRIIRREFQVTVAAGELISGEVLHASATLNWLRDRNAHPVDFVMSRIHTLNPERTNPEIRPLYERLSEDIPEGLLLQAA